MKLAKFKKSRAKSPVAVGKTVNPPPLGPMQRLQQEINRLLGNPLASWLYREEPLGEDWMPVVNVYDEKDSFVVEAELPGVKRNEIKIYTTGDTLNIAGIRQGEQEEMIRDTYRSERCFGHFHRMVSLPAPIHTDQIDAHYKNGILTITCPKTEEAKRKEIKVKVD